VQQYRNICIFLHLWEERSIVMGKDSSGKQQDRQSGMDRRQFTFTIHIRERRNGNERRSREGKEEKSKISSQNLISKPDDSEPAEKS
jgi:hypothetical protein